MESFSEIFKALRKDKMVTQEQVADVLGVSAQAVSRWETGASYPDITILPAISAFFETTVDQLLGIRQPVKKQKLLYIQFRWQESADAVNKYLEDGWTIKDMQTHPLTEGQHPEGAVVLEKVIY